ncbi:hypothetical protein BAUCODRAFT_491648 [Baudoinia panamericana UAMH 10762]|uniref:Carrier domain-containing protein n=1 Tax=Baudoinia panamericana (strain UAMH 10762) TaxID=717646 RepID=M2LQY4_BAUPA|nr:uncharacterized protein BAUCODRAFT_491648 [Baudoinia panamericana UAMH 10762]EMC96842.1 hypothetical protein BAUCODRAFT_491648 [Baudoinia panamericana UAMH 10762]
MASTATLTLPTRTVLPTVADEDAPKPAAFSHAHYPSIETFWTIEGLLKSHAADSDQKPLIGYPAHDVDDFEEHTAAQLDRYTDAAVDYYRQHGLQPADSTLEKAPVIAILSPTSFEVIVTFFALNRLGYACLFLSTRLTAPAYARLMRMCECSVVIHPPSFGRMIPEIGGELPGCSGSPVLLRRHWYECTQSKSTVAVSETDRKRRASQVAWILHSSGSTGFPKPIFLSNLQCLANFRKSFGLRAFTASPLFHSGGLMEFGRAFYAKAPMYLANHAFPVTTTNILRAVQAAKPQFVIAVPYVLKLLAETEAGVRALAATELVLFNGSGCPDDLGDRLVAAGVNLVANYGATETGQLMTSYRGMPPTDNEWSYLRLWSPVAEHTLMDEIAPGVFEAVGLEGLPSKGPSNSKPPYSDKNPQNSFRTADLFTRHPSSTKNNYYKYLSRLDDRITLVMGEKVLPLPMESRIRQEDIVREAVVFGFQQAVPGVLIFRSTEHGLAMSDREYLDAVWPAVEAANAKAESFSHIMKDLVIIQGSEVEYARTDKGTFIRAQVYQQFDTDIKAAYARLESTSEGQKRLALDVPQLEQWLLERFQQDLRIPLSDSKSDIFAAGVDSLQTMRIWRTMKQKLDLGEDGDKLSANIVFEKGTVAALARYLYALRVGASTDGEADEDEVEIMEELIKKYSTFANHHPTPHIPQPAKEVVLVTGATGNLGAYLVASLLKHPGVSEVCALVRAPGEGYVAQKSATTRVLAALRDRQIDVPVEDLGRLRILASDFGDSNLGLGPYTLEYLLENVTCVIHSAWAVNFNLGVRSFEDQHIRGTNNLINFCLRSRLQQPARFYFCSSVSTTSSTPKPAVIPERLICNLRHAQKTGYGRSKMVSEHITSNAMRETGMEARVLRIGQLSGGSDTGIWNDTEAIALMVRSALTTGALPALDERPSWLPVDVCAQACVDIALPAARGQAVTADRRDVELVYHVLNPQTFSWKDDLIPCLRAVSEKDPQKNPSIKLLDFWRGKYGSASKVRADGEMGTTPPASDDDDQGAAGLTFETTETIRDCPLLGSVRQPVAEGLIEKYVKSWMSRWVT